jgi:DNA-binding transcriptional ArsR family regulator
VVNTHAIPARNAAAREEEIIARDHHATPVFPITSHPEARRYAVSGIGEMTMTPLARLVQIHKAIGHPVRIRLLAALRTGPLCGCQMTALMKLAPSTVSEHLSELRKAGLVIERKDGRWVEYRLSESAVREGIFDPVWPTLDGDPEATADGVVIKELRRVPLEELCGVSLDLERLRRPLLTTAVARAARIRASAESAR